MEPFENRLFDLLENFSFDQLNEDDRLFVLTHSSEKEYRAQQKMMETSQTIEYPIVIPLPLTISKKKVTALRFPIPLYKVLIGAAAAAIGVWFFWPTKNNIEIRYSEKTKTIVDTVYVTKSITDTVFINTKQPLIARASEKRDTIFIYSENMKETPSKRMLEPGANPPLVVLDENVLKTKGKSLKNDETANLLTVFPEFGL